MTSIFSVDSAVLQQGSRASAGTLIPHSPLHEKHGSEEQHPESAPHTTPSAAAPASPKELNWLQQLFKPGKPATPSSPQHQPVEAKDDLQEQPWPLLLFTPSKKGWPELKAELRALRRLHKQVASLPEIVRLADGSRSVDAAGKVAGIEQAMAALVRELEGGASWLALHGASWSLDVVASAKRAPLFTPSSSGHGSEPSSVRRLDASWHGSAHS